MAEVATPAQAPREESSARNTRQADPESAHQANLAPSKRTQPVNYLAPPRFSIGGGTTSIPVAQPSVAAAISEHLSAARKTAEIRENIINILAEAVDNCMSQYKEGIEASIATELKERVVQAILSSPATNAKTPRLNNSRSSSSSSSSNNNNPLRAPRSYAEVAAPPKISGEDTSSSSSGSRAPRSLGSRTDDRNKAQILKTDLRILVRVNSTNKSLIYDTYAARIAICQNIQGITLKDIPRAASINTGWAITPANQEIKDKLMEAQNKELLLKALKGEAVEVPTTWYSYAVPGVRSGYFQPETRSILPVTKELVEEEVIAQTGVSPVKCTCKAPVGDNPTTWVIHFLEPVRPFQLFGSSERAQLIRKNPKILHHNPGCQGFCNPTKCNKAPRCLHCGIRTQDHEGMFGEQCERPAQCANCLGPHRAGYEKCPTRPKIVNGQVIRINSKDRKVLRKAGLAAYKHLHDQAERQQVRIDTESSAPQTSDSDQQGQVQPPPLPRKRKNKGNQPTRSNRQSRTSAFTGSYNLAEMSGSTLIPRAAHTESSSSGREDTTTDEGNSVQW